MSPDSYDPRISATMRGVDDFPSLAGYEFLETIGRGEIGVVYKAEQLRLKRLVAIKALVFDSYLDDRSRRLISRFLDEARALGRIGAHENIVQVHDIVADRDGNDYIVMELVEGPTLADRMEKGPPLSLREALRVARGAARGLDRAHRAGVVHRDVKPGNIMIDQETGSAKLVDFGVARVQGAKTRTGTSERIGAPLYASPEQMERDSEVDGRSDVYSLAATLYHLVCGRPPFEAKTPIELMEKRLREEPPKPSSLAAGIDPKLEEIVLKGMARRPADRYQTAGALAEAIDALLRGRSEEQLAAALPAARPSGESPAPPATPAKGKSESGVPAPQKKTAGGKQGEKAAAKAASADDAWGRRLRSATTSFVGWVVPSIMWILYTAVASGEKSAAETFRAFHHALLKLAPSFAWAPFERVIDGVASNAPLPWALAWFGFHALFLPAWFLAARWAIFRWKEASPRGRVVGSLVVGALALTAVLDHFAFLFLMERLEQGFWAGTQIFILVPFSWLLCRGWVLWPKAPLSIIFAAWFLPGVAVELVGFAWTQGLLSAALPVGLHAALLVFAKEKLAGAQLL